MDMVEFHLSYASSSQNNDEQQQQQQSDQNSAGSGAKTTPAVASSLSQRIELLDSETRSCWRRVDELEDEEASLNHQFMRLEKTRRGERLEILSLEQACKAEEISTLHAQEITADLDAKSQVLEGLAADAAEDAAAAAAEDTTSVAPFKNQQVADGSDGHNTCSRVEGSATLLAALNEMPSHEGKRKQLSSMLQHTEHQTRSEIAEAARPAAELRRSARKRDAERLDLEHETTALRNGLGELAEENEIQARMDRAIQIGKGLERRLKHASSKLASVRDSLAQGPAKHMEEEEQQSLQLMQGIAEAKARLRSRQNVSEASPWTGSTNRGRGGRALSLTPALSQSRLQMQYSRGGVRESHQTSRQYNWGGGWS